MEKPVLLATQFEKVADSIQDKARDLEKILFRHEFVVPCAEDVILALRGYQNRDGGFGIGLENDFHLPLSTPMATSIGLRILHTLPNIPEKIDLVEDALHYLFQTYDPIRKGWYAVRSEVNDFPHAVWWTWNPETKQTAIDNHWGNPSAELIGYLYFYRDLVPEEQYQHFIDHNLELAIAHLQSIEKFVSEHEIYCYIRLYRLLPEKFQTQMKDKLEEAVKCLIVTDPEQWSNYVPTPLHFVEHPVDERFGISDESIDMNLSYIVQKFTEDGLIFPNWSYSENSHFWQKVSQYWAGVLSLKNLQILREFDRIQGM